MRHEEEGFSSGSVLLSFLLGGMVGAGLALLLAPQSGTETRRRIRELAEDVKEKASGYVDDAKEKVLTSVEKGKEIYGEKKSSITAVLDEKKSAIAAAIEAGKEAYEKEIHK